MIRATLLARFPGKPPKHEITRRLMLWAMRKIVGFTDWAYCRAESAMIELEALSKRGKR